MSSSNPIHLKAARRILRPLVRVMLRNGIACGAIEELLRKTYVEVAFDTADSTARKATVSSVSAETGLSRKEVKRLRETRADPDASDQKFNRAIRVISGWLNDPDFCSPEGIPHPLALGEDGGRGGANFTDLVKRHSGDITPRAMLDLLVSAGSVDTTDGLAHLVRHAYVPGRDADEIIRIFGKDTRELMNTIDHNLVCDADRRWYQRKVSNPRVDPESVEAFRALAGRRSQRLLEELDSWLAEHEAASTERGQYVSLGIYYFHESRDEEESG